MDLSNYIEELLYANDCVIIPNIGGFIVNYSPANINLIEQQISPANKQVSFNPKLVNNDGLLANFVMQKEQINYKQALQLVEDWAGQIEQDLFNKKIIHFAKIGKLYFNTDSKLEFVPAQTNFLLDAYGLPDISCYPILRNKQYAKKVVAITSDKAAETTVIVAKKKKKRAILAAMTLPRVATAAVVLLLLAFSPYIISNLFSEEQEATNTSLATNENEENTNTTATASILPLPTTNNTTSEVIEKKPLIEDTVATIAIDEKENIMDENTQTYLIILGAFSKKSNADRLSKKLEKDNYMPVMDKSASGLHRVGAEISCTKEEFETHFEYIKENYNKKAWIAD